MVNTADRTFAEVFPPGEFIKDELEARGWTQADLAEILGRDPVQINLIVKGKQAITPETAKQLSDAFGTGVQFWLNLESAYRAFQLSQGEPEESPVARRAMLYEKFPVREMVKRGWIEPSDNVEVLEKRLCDFYGIDAPDEEPRLAHAARKSTKGTLTPLQKAWLFRVRHLAHAVWASAFSTRSLNECLAALSLMRRNREDIRRVPQVLAEHGIRLVIVELFPTTKIDGVTLWLDKQSPVVALSFRYDRIDWFWHTLAHELVHVQKRDGVSEPILDTDLVGEDAAQLSESERFIDAAACEFLIPQKDINKFIARTGPYYSKQQISLFAERLKVHPGIIVGQLQHRKEMSYAYNREMLPKVLSIISASAVTDGWGNVAPI
jgi:HTH-type transcriptional regulator / antitoxin HigA